MIGFGRNLHRSFFVKRTSHLPCNPYVLPSIRHRGVNRSHRTSFSSHPSLNTFQRNLTVSKVLYDKLSPRKLSESFLDGTSGTYIEDMYQAWKKDPSSVHASWASYFKNVDAGVGPGDAHSTVPPSGSGSFRLSGDSSAMISESMRLMLLIRAYQVKGHALANLDPLGLSKREVPPELKLESYGFGEEDLDREFQVGAIGHGLVSGFLAERYMHIQSREQINWIREKLETDVQYSFSSKEKTTVLEGLCRATHFERFLALKWGASKRFGLDGCESLIPGVAALVDRGSELGLENIVMGMPHRGRLNILANIVGKPVESIFHEFTGGSSVSAEDDFYAGSGDVKYHLGTSHDRICANGKKVHISLLANPSHLEAVNPIAEGKVRAKQQFSNDTKREKTLSLLLHGDAAFAAQGVVYETFDMSGLQDYTTGGTIHIIVNNQIGFTTDPRSSRGSMYCTDVAKAAGAPIFHVNGDDPEAVAHVCRLAMEWRQKYHKDVVLDIICYRRYGHNEADEPRYTQPTMYKQIDKQTPIMEKYSQELIQEKVITENQFKEMSESVEKELYNKFEASKKYKPHPNEWFDSLWKGFKSPRQLSRIRNTGVAMEVLKKVGAALSEVPPSFNLHPALKRILKQKKEMFETGEKIDWGTAEALAFGTLLLEGNHVRVSGQDVERGTFSHRHAVLHDQQTNEQYIPLNHINASKTFHICNSSLSEYGVLGFELGFSLQSPNSLVCWEAQFGDFVNGAQVILDQFISSGEAKWRRMTGLTLLLPHGYDGMGPEHSSARLERFLQLTDSDADVIPEGSPENVIARTNFQVVNCTTPANYYHVLRRQIHREFRKPLVVMSPKNLLRHRDAVSSLRDMCDDIEHARFYRLLPDPAELVEDSQIKKVLFCSGKVYYELAAERTQREIKNVAIVRVEQLHPFPFDRVIEQAQKYSNARIVWVQEEPKNMGAWSWIAPHFRTALKPSRGNDFFPEYAGRPAAAAPATGLGSEHHNQWTKMMNDAFAM